jgi:hypothetical protein
MQSQVIFRFRNKQEMRLLAEWLLASQDVPKEL